MRQDFIEGENLVIELRYSKTGLQHLPELAAELVHLKVEVIEASGDFAPRVAQQATSTIPIVAFTDDVLGAGLVDSLSRPGANTTGLTILAPELSAKRLEVLSEIVPGLSRVARPLGSYERQVASRDDRDCSPCYEDTIANPGGPTSRSPCRRIRCGQEGKAQAINMFASPFLASLTREIIGLAAENRLPTIYHGENKLRPGGWCPMDQSLP